MKIRDIIGITVIVILTIALVQQCREKPQIETRFVKQKPITDTIDKPVPIFIDSNNNEVPEMFVIKDTIFEKDTIHIKENIDTLSIIKDFLKTRKYREQLFDNDTIGKLVIDAKVRANKLQKLSYDFTPIRKEVEIKHYKRIQPFVGTNISTNGNLGFNGGVFIDHWGFSIGYLKHHSDNGAQMGVFYKF